MTGLSPMSAARWVRWNSRSMVCSVVGGNPAKVIRDRRSPPSRP